MGGGSELGHIYGSAVSCIPLTAAVARLVSPSGVLPGFVCGIPAQRGLGPSLCWEADAFTRACQEASARALGIPGAARQYVPLPVACRGALGLFMKSICCGTSMEMPSLADVSPFALSKGSGRR